jgi:hypothetical protein
MLSIAAHNLPLLFLRRAASVARSRSPSWIGFRATCVPFLVADLGPDVDPFILHLFAALAQKERDLISKRTTEALAAVTRRPP